MSHQDFLAERATLARNKDRLLESHEGQFVVIIGEDVLDTTATLEEALRVGFARANGPDFFTARLRSHAETTWIPAAIIEAS